MWILVKAAKGWAFRHSARLGAALAYYSIFSLGPLLLIVTSVAGFFFGEDAARSALTQQFRSLLGPVGSQAIEAMLKGASSPTSGKQAAFVRRCPTADGRPRRGGPIERCAQHHLGNQCAGNRGHMVVLAHVGLFRWSVSSASAFYSPCRLS